MWLHFFIALGASAASCGLIIAWARRNPHALMDTSEGPQKFHHVPTPRVGGAALYLGFLLAGLVAWSSGLALVSRGLLLSSVVVVAAGLGEDLTKRVSVGIRLSAAMFAGGLAYFISDAQIHRLDVWFLDQLLHWPIAAVLMTAFAVAGIANAVNIIDGYNGLSGGYSVIALTAIGAIAAKVADLEILMISVMLGGAIIGFLIWNFPGGRIFMGDAGAYFVGFMIAELSVLLVCRHAQVSPWFPLVVVAYPVWETLYSIYRKRFVRGTSPGQPDGLHFHMLVYKRVVRWKTNSAVPSDKALRNALTSPYLWLLASMPIVAGVVFWDNSLLLAIAGFSFGAVYNFLYRGMVTFNVPRWVRLSSSKPGVLDSEEDGEMTQMS